MRLTPFVTALALLLVMGAAPANAYPIDSRVLTHNALYRTGQLAPADCPEPRYATATRPRPAATRPR